MSDLEIPHFNDFEKVKKEENDRAVLSEFKNIFNDLVKSVNEIGKEFLLNSHQIDLIKKNMSLIKTYLNKLDWDFELAEKQVIISQSCHPWLGTLITFKKYYPLSEANNEKE